MLYFVEYTSGREMAATITGCGARTRGYTAIEETPFNVGKETTKITKRLVYEV